MTRADEKLVREGDRVTYKRWPFVVAGKSWVMEKGLPLKVDLAFPERPEHVVYHGVLARFVARGVA